jgi:multiple sugar transport system substrate-binding protein
LQSALAYADVTIKLWHHWGGNRVPLMEKQVKDFEKKHPGIKVEVSLKPWDNRLQILLTAIAAGDPPNVTMLGRQDIPSFVKQSAVVPLDKWMKEDGISRDLFYSSEINGSIVNDKVYILPLPTGGARTLIWWNKKLFADAGLYNFPDTWSETLNAARKLTKINGKNLKRAMMRFNVKNKNDLPFLILLNANGGKWLSSDGKKILFNTSHGIAAMQFIIDLTNLNGGYEEQEAFYSQTGEWEKLLVLHSLH